MSGFHKFSGILSGTVMQLATDLGRSFFYASLPIGVVGLVSAYFQSRVCCAGIGIVAKQGNGGMGITFAIMVELYAILALIISILMVVGVPVGFVNVVEAKEELMETVPDYIVARGRKGGSNVAASIVNAVLYQLVNREG